MILFTPPPQMVGKQNAFKQLIAGEGIEITSQNLSGIVYHSSTVSVNKTMLLYDVTSGAARSHSN